MIMGKAILEDLESGYENLKVWWPEATLYWFSLLFTVHSYKFIHTHSFITFAEFRSSFFIAASSGEGSPLGCRAENRTRGRLTAAQHATNWAMPHPLSHAAPYLAMPHPPEPCRTLLSHAAPFWKSERAIEAVATSAYLLRNYLIFFNNFIVT